MQKSQEPENPMKSQLNARVPLDASPATVPSGHRRTTKRRWAVIIVSALIALAALVMVLRSQQKPTLAEKPAHAPVLTVTASLPTMKPLAQELSVNGTISAWDPISVGATTGGLEVKAIEVEEGALVKKGQVLARLDSSQLQAQLDSEKARLASGVASVSKSIQPNRPEDINGLAAAVAQAQANVKDAEAAVLQAQENFNNASTNLKRYKYL